jgi:hypothetical protein
MGDAIKKALNFQDYCLRRAAEAEGAT